jgi:hypothetical protein
MIGFLVTECALTPHAAIHDTPLPIALILAAAAHQQNGGKFAGPTYEERARGPRGH